jgi:hypothetical protein
MRWFVPLVVPFAVASAQTPPKVWTTVLPDPDSGKAYEPFLALDAANHKRIVVASMVKDGRVGHWLWETSDGGLAWTSRPMPDFVVEGKPAEAGADMMVDAARDGTILLGAMGGFRGPDLTGGIFVGRRAAAGNGFSRSVLVVPNRKDPATGDEVIHDRPWMLVDRTSGSPYRGTVYLTVGTRPIPAGKGLAPAPTGWNIVLSTSKDDGRTFSPPRTIVDSAMYGQMATGPGGALEMVYPRPVGVVAEADGIFHVRSTDGGASFDRPVPIVVATGDTMLELPTIAARPNGDLLACWSEGVVGPSHVIAGYSTSPARFRIDEHANTVRCAERRGTGAWRAGRPAIALPPGTTAGWPTIAGNATGWYLLLYLSDASHTEVALFRSRGSEEFGKIATVATTPGLGVSHICFSAAAACMRSRSDDFRPGDVLAMVAEPDRLVAAYVLPRPGKPLVGSNALQVALVDLR